jgi:L-threonine synthase (EC 4.2.3.1)
MKLYNIKDHSETVSFSQAVQQGLGRGQGLFFPESLPYFDDIEALLAMPLVARSSKILSALIGDELPKSQVSELVSNAFSFAAPLEQVDDHIHALELFHGPTLAFKDFGGRFMAQSLAAVSEGKKITILTATSGDTGRRLPTRSTVLIISTWSSCTRKAKSARCRKNSFVHLAAIFIRSRSMALLMIAKAWSSKPLMIASCVRPLALIQRTPSTLAA